MTVELAQGWILSLWALIQLWHRDDIKPSWFWFWTALLMAWPWVGAVMYAGWTLAPTLTAVVLVLVGTIGIHDLIGPGIEFVRTRSWVDVSVLTYDGNRDDNWDEGDTIKPRYTYTYAGRQFEGSRLSFLAPPWYHADYNIEAQSAHVFVDPTTPSESVIQRGFPRRILRRGVLMFLIMCIGYLIAWDSARWRARSGPLDAS
jgi:hypothetical protein